ncbi:MAG: HAMP domain-containing sensor histidine kinase [Clostridium septicum]|uniref:sensor histidine kinase n=1 Tax=Clostridium septicum TaxID=1504 RepID=UPI0025856431|nr:HAMP domain-containing sensor histidine kinase [Clostridium septicum]MDU1314383.1 HAMP domain-containing sensor histidine kinase [Clostridium septicum]
MDFNSLGEKDIIIEKSLLARFFYTCIVLLIVFFNDLYRFNFAIKVLCIVISILMFLMSNVKRSRKDLGFIKYIGIGFIYIGILIMGQLVCLTYFNDSILFYLISLVLNTFKSILLIIALILNEKEVSLVKSNIIFFLTIIFLFIILKYPLINIDFFYNNIGIILINFFMFIVNGLFIKKSNNIKCSREKRLFLIWIIIIIINNILEFSKGNNSVILSYIISIISVNSFIIMYKLVERNLLSNAYKQAFLGLRDLQKSNTELNDSLMRRERLLKDTKKQIAKSEKRYEEMIESISEGILIFNNEHLSYINNDGLDCIFCKLSGEFINEDINYILEVLVEQKFTRNEIDKGFIKVVKINDKSNNERVLEITLINMDCSNKILLIKDITHLDEHRVFMKNIRKYISTEKVKDEFYSNISHELRTPINVISSALQLNKVNISNGELEKLQRNNKVVKQNCLRLIRTINNFIDTNKLTEGYLESNKKVYNIVNIIENVVLASNKYMLLKKNILIFDSEEEDIYVYCDRNQIERIMLNILSNSLKHGEIEGKIQVNIRCLEDNVEIIVENDAKAIPEDKRRVIFDKFTKIDNSLARPSEGSGLGLFLTKKLVELNNGKIYLETNGDIGNMFIITFPYSENENEAYSNTIYEINELDEKVDIEFSDIYF